MEQDLARLFMDVPVDVLSPGEIPVVPVSGIVSDSRKVQAGNLFVAIEGGSVDGHDFIHSAIKNGASAVVGMRSVELPVPYVQVRESRQALAYLSAAFYDFPARHLTVIGVTGTDGKTTTTSLIYQILISAGYRVGVISSVNAVIGDEVLDTGLHVTTPGAQDLQRYLARMLAAGSTHVVLEATSHGLEQHRATACEFDIGVVTNITHEHLDYHGTYEAYRASKAKLLTQLAMTRPKEQGNPKLAVLNRDDHSYEYLQDVTTVRQIVYSLQPDADLWAREIHYHPSGINFIATGPNGFQLPIESNLVGSYNVSNCLAALATTIIGLGISPEAAKQGIAALQGIPGRMERIDLGQDFIAIVDFAHTPNGLRQAIKTAQQMTDGKILAIFGSAGLRDRQKRRLMAEISIRLADITILTAEDPRTESLDNILDEMAEAARESGGVENESFWRIPDRGEAIRLGVDMAHPGDVVISCGKGHEQSMCFGETEYPWDDRRAMRAAVAENLGIVGYEMPYLPTQ